MLPTMLQTVGPVLPAFCDLTMVPGLHTCSLHLLSSGTGNNQHLWNSWSKPGQGLGRAHGQERPPLERHLAKARMKGGGRRVGLPVPSARQRSSAIAGMAGLRLHYEVGGEQPVRRLQHEPR